MQIFYYDASKEHISLEEKFHKSDKVKKKQKTTKMNQYTKIWFEIEI